MRLQSYMYILMFPAKLEKILAQKFFRSALLRIPYEEKKLAKFCSIARIFT